MAVDFSVSGQHYLFNVQTFAHTALALGGDEYHTPCATALPKGSSTTSQAA